MAALFDPGVLTTAQTAEASGSKHDEVLGLHVITTMSILHGSESLLPVVETETVRAGGWTLAISAPKSYDAWLRSNETALAHEFASMQRELREMFPDIASRHYELIVVPPNASFDAAWVSFAFREKGIGALRFAARGPDTGPPQRSGSKKSFASLPMKRRTPITGFTPPFYKIR